jgi:iron complex transport system substrate-binding protein
MRRIVSLISSATEMVHALGALHLLVGRSHECDHPPSVLTLPVCTRPLIDASADSRAIDLQVRNSARNALSIYEVFDDVLERLQPTHILTQTQCDVCAVSLRDVEQSVAARLASAPKIVALNAASLEEIWDDLRKVGEAVGAPAEPLIENLRSRMKPVSTSASPTVACIEWIEPLMAAGNWTPELIARAGGVDLFGKAGVHSPWIEFEDLLARDPDVIVVAPCGFDLARTRGEMHWLTDRPQWAVLKAVRAGCVWLADGNQLFNRPGPRIVESFEVLRQILSEGNASEMSSFCELYSGKSHSLPHG